MPQKVPKIDPEWTSPIMGQAWAHFDTVMKANGPSLDSVPLVVRLRRQLEGTRQKLLQLGAVQETIEIPAYVSELMGPLKCYFSQGHVRMLMLVLQETRKTRRRKREQTQKLYFMAWSKSQKPHGGKQRIPKSSTCSWGHF